MKFSFLQRERERDSVKHLSRQTAHTHTELLGRERERGERPAPAVLERIISLARAQRYLICKTCVGEKGNFCSVCVDISHPLSRER